MSLVEQARSIYTHLAAAPEGLTSGQLRYAANLTKPEFDRALRECQVRTAGAASGTAVVGFLPDVRRYVIARTPAQAEGVIEALGRNRNRQGYDSELMDAFRRAYAQLYGVKAGESVSLFNKQAETPSEKPQAVVRAQTAVKPEVTPNTQMSQVLEHLEAGKSLTPLEALNLYGSLRLGALIHDLRKLGYEIETEMVAVGRNKRVGKYSLKQKELVAR